MVPVDLAEHDVAGEHHEFGCGATLVGDRQARALLIEAQAGQQAIAVEVAAVGNARVEAVTGQVVHLVDVYWSGEERPQDPTGRIVGRARHEARDTMRVEPPLLGEDDGDLPGSKDSR